MIEKFHPVTHVIFDMDGLLLNTEPKYDTAINTVCEKYGSKYSLEAKLSCLGRPAKDGAKRVLAILNLPISVDQYLSELNVECQKLFVDVELMPGADRLVRHFSSKGIPIAIATSSQKSNFDLKAKGKEEFFGHFNHVVIGSDNPEVKHGKPSPDIFLLAAKKFPSPPESMKNVLVFEDSMTGVQAGLAAGMQVVWVPDPILDITKQESTQVLKSLEDFKPELFHLPSFS